ncbi:MAG: DUF6066 family protein [Pseudomonadota bacterium]
MTTLLCAVLVLAAKPAPSFETLKDGAAVLERPGAATAALVGECSQDDPELQIQCQENIKTARQDHLDKRYYIDLGAGHQDLLAFEALRGSSARFLWVPMYDPGNGLALTAVKPGALTKDGWPVLKKKVLDGAAPKGQLASDLTRLARLGQINIEIIGRFGKTWALTHKGKKVQGVVFEIQAVRLSQARTGETVIETLY